MSIDKDMWDKFNDIFKDFGKNLDKIPKDVNSLLSSIPQMRSTTPESFMNGSEFTTTQEIGKDQYGNNTTKTTYMSKDGKKKLTRTVVNASPSKGDSNLTKRNRLYTLEQDLIIAVENQEYEKCARMRDEIAQLKKELYNIKP